MSYFSLILLLSVLHSVFSAIPVNPIRGVQSATVVGCFPMKKDSLRLNAEKNTPRPLSPNSCMQLCAMGSHVFAGVANGDKCYCGTQYDEANLKDTPVAESFCTTYDNVSVSLACFTPTQNAYHTGMPCVNRLGQPDVVDPVLGDMTPKSGWCGGNQLIYVWKLKLTN